MRLRDWADDSCEDVPTARKTAQPMTMRRKNFAPLQHQEFLFIETSIWDVDQSANSTA
jgi:hypothetical protein